MVVNLLFAIWLTLGPGLPQRFATSYLQFPVPPNQVDHRVVQGSADARELSSDRRPLARAGGRVRTKTECVFGRSARRISPVSFARPRERWAFTVPSAKPRVRAASLTECPSRSRNSNALRNEGES